MPNHVYGIVVLVVFGDYRIGTGIFCIIILSGGFETRPHGDTSYGDFGIIILARVFLHYSIWWAGLKPAPTRVRWGCCANHVCGIVVLVGDLGSWCRDFGIIVL
jgi:hypothetical protein